jgi:hypothetical protein
LCPSISARALAPEYCFLRPLRDGCYAFMQPWQHGLAHTLCVLPLEDFKVLSVIKTIVILLTVLLLPGIATAEEVYKGKDKKGVVEYSDQSFSGAKEVDVQPNVIQVEPANPPASAAPPAEEMPSTTTEGVAPSGGVVDAGGAGAAAAEAEQAAAVEAERRRRAAAVEAERRREVDRRGPGVTHEPAGRGRR